MFFEEEDGGEELEIVVLFREAVTLVLRHEIPDGLAVVANGFDHLLGFGDGHARVVLALTTNKGLLIFLTLVVGEIFRGIRASFRRAHRRNARPGANRGGNPGCF